MLLLLWLLIGCQGSASEEKTASSQEAQLFLDSCAVEYQKAYSKDEELRWQAQYTDSLALPDHLQSFFASAGFHKRIKTWVQQGNELTLMQNRQMEMLLYHTAFYDGIPADSIKALSSLVASQKKRIEREMAGAKDGCGWSCLDALFKQTDADKTRMQQWMSAHHYWGSQPEELLRMASLRNLHVAQAQYPNFMAYSLRRGQTNEEQAQAKLKRLLQDLRPLFELLHTHARVSFASKYQQGIPLKIPAHWLGNLEGSSWNISHYNPLADSLGKMGAAYPESLASRFFAQQGFQALPNSYLKPAGAHVPTKAWHLDKQGDIRLVWSPQTGIKGYTALLDATTQAYAFDAYSNEDVPVLLREGASASLVPAWQLALKHEGIEWAWKQYHQADSAKAAMNFLLSEAMAVVPTLVFYAGVVTQFEQDMYSGRLSPSGLNERWWQLMQQYMGVAPPFEGAKKYCSPAAYRFLQEQPCSAFDICQSTALAYNLRKEFARQPPGTLFRQTLYGGQMLKWRDVSPIGNEEVLNASVILKRYQILMGWLKGKYFNQKNTLPTW